MAKNRKRKKKGGKAKEHDRSGGGGVNEHVSEEVSRTSNKRPSEEKRAAAGDYPYEVDYCDHFETPLRAYEDVLPLLDLVAEDRGRGGGVVKKGEESSSSSRRRWRDRIALYDPYYCAGRSAALLHSLGFTDVIHAKRDFYADVRNGAVPAHDALVTNPPYSSDHKERCIEFSVGGLRGGTNGGTAPTGGPGPGPGPGSPFFLLMPNYVATKEYWRQITASSVGGQGGEEPEDICYVVPPVAYEYDHPEDTGHDVPPFRSVWFCGLPSHLIRKARVLYSGKRSGGGDDAARLATSLEELRRWGAVPTVKRGNPKQRRKKRKQMEKEKEDGSNAADQKISEEGSSRGFEGAERKSKKRRRSARVDDGGGTPKKAQSEEAGGPNLLADHLGTGSGTKKKGNNKSGSRYRDAGGVRIKKRF